MLPQPVPPDSPVPVLPVLPRVLPQVPLPELAVLPQPVPQDSPVPVPPVPPRTLPPVPLPESPVLPQPVPQDSPVPVPPVSPQALPPVSLPEPPALPRPVPPDPPVPVLPVPPRALPVPFLPLLPRTSFPPAQRCLSGCRISRRKTPFFRKPVFQTASSSLPRADVPDRSPSQFLSSFLLRRQIRELQSFRRPVFSLRSLPSGNSPRYAGGY